MEGDVTLGLFLSILARVYLQVLLVDVEGGVEHGDFEQFTDGLGLLVVFCLSLLQFHVETLDYFLYVVVLHFQVAFGLCYPVLEQLEFGV